MDEYIEDPIPLNIYEDEDHFVEENTLNLSKKELISVPDINNRYLCVSSIFKQLLAFHLIST